MGFQSMSADSVLYGDECYGCAQKNRRENASAQSAGSVQSASTESASSATQAVSRPPLLFESNACTYLLRDPATISRDAMCHDRT